VDRYGVLKGDFVVIVANTIGLALVATLIRFKGPGCPVTCRCPGWEPAPGQAVCIH